MAATIINFSVTEETEKQIDTVIVDRLEAVFTKVFGMINPNESKEIMDIEEARRFLKNCSETTLNNYVRDGLKKHKKGQKVYYLRNEIISYIASLPAE